MGRHTGEQPAGFIGLPPPGDPRSGLRCEGTESRHGDGVLRQVDDRLEKLIDKSFAVLDERGIQAAPLPAVLAKQLGGAVEAVIVAVTWVFAVTVLRFAWTRRGELLGAG